MCLVAAQSSSHQDVQVVASNRPSVDLAACCSKIKSRTSRNACRSCKTSFSSDSSFSFCDLACSFFCLCTSSSHELTGKHKHRLLIWTIFRVLHPSIHMSNACLRHALQMCSAHIRNACVPHVHRMSDTCLVHVICMSYPWTERWVTLMMCFATSVSSSKISLVETFCLRPKRNISRDLIVR